MSARARLFLFSLAAVVLFALPLAPEVLGTRRLVFRDAQITHWPWRRAAMAAWLRQEVPFINESASGGQPLLANPNAVLLYPTLLGETLWAPATAFNLHYLAQVVWALFGARCLGRRLGLSPGAAFAAGAAYAFSGMFLSYASAFANSSAAAAWLPWCAAAGLDLVRAREIPQMVRAGAATAIAFALQLLAGEPALSLLTLVFTAFLSGFELIGRWRAGAIRLIVAVIASGLTAAALAAALILPLAAVLPLTFRGQHLYSARAFSASPFQLWRTLEWLFPRISGDPGALGPGGHWQYALHPGDVFYIWSATLGVLPLILILLGALRRDFWDRRALWLAAGATGTLLLAFGSALPLYRLLFFVQALRRLRYPIKFYLLTTLCVALLFGLALESLRRRQAGGRETALLLAVAALYAATYFAAQPGGPVDAAIRPLLASLKAPPDALLSPIRANLRGDALLGLAAAAVAGLFAFLGARKPKPSRGEFLGIATIVLALPAGLPLFVSADEKTLERLPALQAPLRGPGRLFVSGALPEFNVLASGTAHPALPLRVSQFARVQIEELIPETGSPFGARYIFDEDPDGSYGWYNRFASEVLSASNARQRCRLLLAFGARWILDEESGGFACGGPVTGVVIAGRRLVLSEIPGAVKDLRWAGRTHYRASLSGTLELVRSEAFGPSTDVVLRGPADRDAPRETSRAELSNVHAEADRASTDVVADAPGHVIFSRTFFRAWRSRLDGAPTPILVANGRDLAVAVPAGRHRVEFEYDRRPFVCGVALQLAAFLALSVSIILARRHRRSAALTLKSPTLSATTGSPTRARTSPPTRRPTSPEDVGSPEPEHPVSE